MNDLNFFSSFEKAKQTQKRKTRLALGIISGLVIVVVLFYGVLGLRMFLLYRGIQKGNAYLNSPEVKVKAAEIKAKREATVSLKQYSANLEKTKKRINATDKISSEFLDTVEKTFPTNVGLSAMELKDYKFTLSGTVPALTSVAELTNNLEQTGLFTRVHVDYIAQNKDGAIYSFGILCELKEVVLK